jgi:hypothetical protein
MAGAYNNRVCSVQNSQTKKKKKGENGWGKDENNLLLEKAMR